MITKVLIVDDEKLERVLIRKAFDWEKAGFEIIGEADNGEEALEFFSMKEPDIILTDINMPYMDGVQLAEGLRNQSKTCKIVMITGYREFEYARRAIKAGVEDFLLKPINIEELEEIVMRLQNQIEQEKGMHSQLQVLKETVIESRQILMESFLQRLVENRVEEEEGIHKLQMYSLDVLIKDCTCINIWFQKAKDKGGDSGNVYSAQILQMVREHTHAVISFIHYLDNVILYFAEEGEEEIIKQITQLSTRIEQALKLNVKMGISNRQTGFGGIAKAYDQTEKAISAGVILGGHTCITYETYEKIKDSSSVKLEMSWKDFIFNLENGLWNKVEDFIDQYTKAISEHGNLNLDYLKLMTMEMISKSSVLLSKFGKSIAEIVGDEIYFDSISELDSIAGMNALLKKMLRKIMEFVSTLQVKKSNALIEHAKEFLDSNLFDSDLGLKMTAKELFVNESYLSRVFKQEAEESLTEYITRKRIEESVKLLNTTDLKAYEIAEQVGIKDPHYFSICFKKQLGVTIKEYKNRNQNNQI